MSRSDRHRKKKTLFWKAYLVYLALIIIAFIAIFFYVRSTMLEYERNSPANYVTWLAEDASDNSELGKYLEKVNFSDTRYGDAKARKDSFYNTVKNAELTAKPAQGSYDSLSPVFDISAGGQPFMTIKISETGSTNKLGIMTLSDWNIDYAVLRDAYSQGALRLSEDGNLDYRLIVPEGFTLLIDGKPAVLEASAETVLSDFEYVADFVDAPKGLAYELSDIYYEPQLAVLNNGGEEIAFEKQADGSYEVNAEFAASPEAKALAESVCDPLAIGKVWSKFMTDDVGGAAHGLYTVRQECRLLDGTNLWSLATKWASNVDITFVSGHTLDSFTNESVSNFVMYNENLFSCDVYFEKNMTISRGIGPRTDIFSNRMFFGNVNGIWYLLDMITLDK